MKTISNSPKQTEAIAADLAEEMAGGECVALFGELGAGKTQFVRGLARGLGANPKRVSSPTFVLLNIYDGAKLKLFHLDAYRIAGEGDFEGIGFAEMLEQNGVVVVVEWAEKVKHLLPGRRVEVRLKTTGKTRREITIRRVNWNAKTDSARRRRER